MTRFLDCSRGMIAPEGCASSLVQRSRTSNFLVDSAAPFAPTETTDRLAEVLLLLWKGMIRPTEHTSAPGTVHPFAAKGHCSSRTGELGKT